jgi:hypothetical protein
VGLSPGVLGELTRDSRNAGLGPRIGHVQDLPEPVNHLLVAVFHAPGIAEQQVLVDARLLHRPATLKARKCRQCPWPT